MEGGNVREEAAAELTTKSDSVRQERWPHRLGCPRRTQGEAVLTLVGPGVCRAFGFDRPFSSAEPRGPAPTTESVDGSMPGSMAWPIWTSSSARRKSSRSGAARGFGLSAPATL